MPQYLLLAKDGTDAEAPGRRTAVRSAHFATLPGMLERGEMLVGGALLDEAGAMTGSVTIVEFPDRAALDAWLEREPYVLGKVWQDITVVPFRLGVMADRALPPTP